MPSSSAYLQSDGGAVRHAAGELRSTAAELRRNCAGIAPELRGGGGVLLALRVRHLAELGVRVAEVHFVADEQLAHVVARVFVDLRQPALHVLEGVHVGDVVHDDDAVRAAVVGARDRAEALLPGGVPDLQLDRLLVEFDRADLLLAKRARARRRRGERRGEVWGESLGCGAGGAQSRRRWSRCSCRSTCRRRSAAAGTTCRRPSPRSARG